MKRYQKFIAKRYLKNFFLLFLALEFFFIGMDLMQNLKDISTSANLQILYVTNQLLYYVNFTLPLSLIFAMLLSLFSILRSNELVSMYALGVSKQEIIKPILIFAASFTVGYILLGFSPSFVHAYEESENIKKYGLTSKVTSDLFLKSDNTYAYIGELLPAEKIGKRLKIFITDNNKLVEVLDAKTAIFKNNYWQLQDVTSIKIPSLKQEHTAVKLLFEHYETKNALEGFKPKIIDTLFQRLSKLTIQDSFEAMKLLEKENLNAEKIKAELYTMIFFPLFAPIAIYGLFFPLPAQRRGTNIALLSAVYIFVILSIWGILFTMAKISANGALAPELGIIAPILVLSAITVYLSRTFAVKHI